jgi:hypothetical protein
MMKKAVRSHHFWICLGLFVAFCVTCVILPTRVTLLLTNSLLLAVSVAVAVAYTPIAWRDIRDSTNPIRQHISLGISLGWTGSALWRVWSIFWLMTGAGPEYSFLIQSDIVAGFQAMIALGATYHLTSPGALGQNSPSLKWIVLGCVIGAAFGIAALLAYYTPNDFARHTADFIEPYVPR